VKLSLVSFCISLATDSACEVWSAFHLAISPKNEATLLACCEAIWPKV
jgi:hypothetical protein